MPHTKVLGQAGSLDSSRLAHFLSEATGVDILEIDALTLGSHGPTMVPVPSQCTIAGKPLTDYLSDDEIEGILDRTRKGGGEIVALLKTGSAYYAPSSAAARMVAAIINDEKAVMPVCAWVSGEYGINDVYLGVPAKLGKDGVEEVVALDLTNDEIAALAEAAAAVKEKVGELHELEL